MARKIRRSRGFDAPNELERGRPIAIGIDQGSSNSRVTCTQLDSDGRVCQVHIDNYPRAPHHDSFSAHRIDEVPTLIYKNLSTNRIYYGFPPKGIRGDEKIVVLPGLKAFASGNDGTGIADRFTAQAFELHEDPDALLKGWIHFLLDHCMKWLKARKLDRDVAHIILALPACEMNGAAQQKLSRIIEQRLPSLANAVSFITEPEASLHQALGVDPELWELSTRSTGVHVLVLEFGGMIMNAELFYVRIYHRENGREHLNIRSGEESRAAASGFELIKLEIMRDFPAREFGALTSEFLSHEGGSADIRVLDSIIPSHRVASMKKKAFQGGLDMFQKIMEDIAKNTDVKQVYAVLNGGGLRVREFKKEIKCFLKDPLFLGHYKHKASHVTDRGASKAYFHTESPLEQLKLLEECAFGISLGYTEIRPRGRPKKYAESPRTGLKLLVLKRRGLGFDAMKPGFYHIEHDVSSELTSAKSVEEIAKVIGHLSVVFAYSVDDLPIQKADDNEYIEGEYSQMDFLPLNIPPSTALKLARQLFSASQGASARGSKSGLEGLTIFRYSIEFLHRQENGNFFVTLNTRAKITQNQVIGVTKACLTHLPASGYASFVEVDPPCFDTSIAVADTAPIPPRQQEFPDRTSRNVRDVSVEFIRAIERPSSSQQVSKRSSNLNIKPDPIPQGPAPFAPMSLSTELESPHGQKHQNGALQALGQQLNTRLFLTVPDTCGISSSSKATAQDHGDPLYQAQAEGKRREDETINLPNKRLRSKIFRKST